jgi:predicted permease
MVLVHALRSLRRAPAFVLIVVLTLALGLAGVGTLGALLQRVLLAPLPYGDPERLVSLQWEDAQGTPLAHSPAVTGTYRDLATQLDGVAWHRGIGANVWRGGDDQVAEHLGAAWISASTLPLLQVQPLLGRGFTADEDRRGGPEAVILSEAEWRSRFAAAPDVLGRILIVNDVPREIVGVMPAGFAFPDARTRLWLPAKANDGAVAGEFIYSALARLAPGATPESAQRELAALLPRVAERHPRLQSGGATAAWLDAAAPRVRVVPLRTAQTAGIAGTLWMLAAVAALILLLAWANVANLLLIRADARRQDVAIRQALGASPRRAATPLLAESALLGAAAAALALLVSQLALDLLRRFGPIELPRLAELGHSPWSVGLIVLLALCSTLLASVLLARWDRAGALTPRLHEGARGQTASRPRQRLRAAAVVLQIAAALVVAASAALLLRTAERLHAVHPGFDAAKVSHFRILLPFARYGDSARVAFYAALTERVAQRPGVQGAGLVARLPLGPGFAPEQDFLVQGAGQPHRLPVNVVDRGYFSAMHIPLLAGRGFGALGTQRPDELLVSRRAARQLFADADPTQVPGRTLRLAPGGPDYRIVGVVGDVHHDDLATPPSPMVYRPQVVAAVPQSEPGPLPSMSLVVRAEIPAEPLAAAVRDSVRALDASIPVFAVGSVDAVVRDSMARLNLMLWLLGAAAVVSLLLGMLGLYGVMAYVVALRSHEFGLRLALGASPRGIARAVLGRGLRLTGAGMVAGLLLFAVIAPLLRAAVAGVAAWDPLALCAAVGLLLASAALACWIPAQRAAAVAPALALRAE